MFNQHRSDPAYGVGEWFETAEAEHDSLACPARSQ
ncbi:hypothetical protein [Nitrobacter sp. TKz-YC01]